VNIFFGIFSVTSDFRNHYTLNVCPRKFQSGTSLVVDTDERKYMRTVQIDLGDGKKLRKEVREYRIG
jgi:hypothetical protein